MKALLTGILALLFTVTGLTQSNSLLDSALQKMEQRDYVGALADLKKLLSKPDPVVYYQMGVCQTGLGQYTEALQSFEKARNSGLDAPELWSSLGITYFNLGDLPRSGEHFKRALKSNAGDTVSLFYLGRIDMKDRLYAKAEEKFREVLRLKPSDDAALYNLGRSLVSQGKIIEGKRVLAAHQKSEYTRDRINTLNDMAKAPRPPASLFADLGNAYLELGETQTAVQFFDKAEKLEPGTPLTALGHGKISYYRADYDTAAKYLTRYLQHVDRSCEAYKFLGFTLKRQKKFSAAREALQNWLKQCPRDTTILSSLAEIEIQEGHLEEALIQAAEIMHLDPTSSSGPYLKAVCRLYQKDLGEAENFALQAVKLDPDDPEYHRLLRAIYLAKGDPQKAREQEEQMQALLGRKKPSNKQ